MKQLIWISCLFLCACDNDENVSLANKWQLESWIKDYGSLVTNIPTAVYYTFDKDNQLTVELEKNDCVGTYTKGSKSISFSSFDCDSLCCDSSYSKNGFNLMLDSITTYSIEGRTLKLRGNSDAAMNFVLVD